MMRSKENEQLEKRLKSGLDKLNEVKRPTPAIEEITLLIENTRRKQRNEFYLFIVIALIFAFGSITFIVNSPIIYLVGQLIILLSIGIVAVLYLRRIGEKHYG